MARAERRTDGQSQFAGTADGVAPGSYNIPMDGFKTERERPVPFASGVDKICCPNLSTSSMTPGPGSYVGQTTSNDGAACQPYKSKVARIGPTAPGSTVYTESTLHKNPGPGTYGTKTEWELALKKPSRAAANPWREEREKTVPSIPPQKLPPGSSSENSMGGDISNTIMKHTGAKEDTTGPGEYDPKTVLTMPAQQQTSFNTNAKKDRSLFEPCNSIDNTLPPVENPGPGAYDGIKSLGENAIADDPEKSATYQFSSKTQLPYQKENPDGTAPPGPGQYERVGEIDKLSARSRNYSTNQGDRTRFGSNAQRVGWSRSIDQPYVDPYHIHHVPGPGTYAHGNAGIFPNPSKEKEKEASKAVPGQMKKKLYGVHHPMIVMALQETTGPLEAFGSTDDRSCNKVLPQTTPAPWAYNKDEARGASMAAELREKKKVGRSGAFGSLADRFYGSPMYGRDDLPDLGLADTETGGYGTGANTEPRSMFISQTPRPPAAIGAEVQCVRVGIQETPAPGAYSIEHEVNYRSPFRHPRHDHLSFGSGQGRFDIGRDLFDGHTPAIANPAPGEYDYTIKPPGTNGAAEMKDKRKMNKPVGSTTKDVGPGSYGSIATPMLKKTFNVSTQAPSNFAGTPRRQRQAVHGESMMSGM